MSEMSIFDWVFWFSLYKNEKNHLYARCDITLGCFSGVIGVTNCNERGRSFSGIVLVLQVACYDNP